MKKKSRSACGGGGVCVWVMQRLCSRPPLCSLWKDHWCMRGTLLPLLTRFEVGSQAASLPLSLHPPPTTLPPLRFRCFVFHWAAFCIVSSLHSAFREERQHFAALANALGQLYPRPSGAHSLSPLNLPNYASHQLSGRSIAVIPETRNAHTPPIFRLLLVTVCVRLLFAAFGLCFHSARVVFSLSSPFLFTLSPSRRLSWSSWVLPALCHTTAPLSLLHTIVAPSWICLAAWLPTPSHPPPSTAIAQNAMTASNPSIPQPEASMAVDKNQSRVHFSKPPKL